MYSVKTAVALRLPFELFRLLGVAFKSPLYLRGATLKAPSLAEGVWGWVNSGFCLKLPRTKTAKFATICHTEALAEVSTTHEVRFCL